MIKYVLCLCCAFCYWGKLQLWIQGAPVGAKVADLAAETVLKSIVPRPRAKSTITEFVFPKLKSNALSWKMMKSVPRR